jgi:hypothetical protein
MIVCLKRPYPHLSMVADDSASADAGIDLLMLDLKIKRSMPASAPDK